MQDSGYKNAAYAIAELIDNSIQAKAKNVELICLEEVQFVSQRNMTRLTRLAVVDDGHGMSADELRCALQFGNGGHLNDRKGIGRFGMGLPNSSMSQGERVDVWSWQNGIGSAMYSYLDLNEIVSGDLREVPKPVKKAVPQEWLKTCSTIGKSGTLVCWSRPNRCTWKTARSIVRNTEEIVGRLYRRFLDNGRARIRMVAFDESDLDKPTFEMDARPNDPMYLMDETSCPEPFSDNPMFEPWGDAYQQEIGIEFRGETHPVTLTYSLAKKEARQGHNPGATPHGKHANRNLGVSVVRADRELELDPKWMPTYDPVARWIGIEVDFPPSLDEVFGVTNNKQSATHLAELAGTDKRDLADRHGYGSYQELKEAWAQDGDPREPLLAVKDAIETTRNALMSLLNAQRKGSGKKRHQHPNSPESKATQATKERQKSGHKGESDEGESLAPEIRTDQVAKGLIDAGVDEAEATELAATTVKSGLKYVFGHADTAAGSFFSVKPKGGAVLITLNTSHPAHDHLVALLEDSADESDLAKLKRQHEQALDGLKLLLIAWARYEDESMDGPARHALQEAREDWGRVARRFLADD
jgi:hypothetical protein